MNIGDAISQRLAFVDANHIAVTFFTRPKDAAQLWRKLHALFVETSTGRVASVSNWSAHYDRIGFLALRDGRYLVRTDHELRLYSPLRQTLETFEMPRTHRPGEERWGTFTTPSRDSVLVTHQVGCTGEIEWLDPQDLKLKHTWQDTEGMFTFPANSRLDASDTLLVATLRFPERKCGAPPLDNSAYIKELPKLMAQKKWCEIAVADFDGSWQTIFRQEGYCPSDARFVSRDAIVFTFGQQILLLQTNGDFILKDALARHEFTQTSRIAHSIDGRRIAVPVLTMRGGSDILDIAAHEVLKRIMVYDLRKRQWICTLDAKKQKIKAPFWLALSPDGSKLAVLTGGFVELYDLPD